MRLLAIDTATEACSVALLRTASAGSSAAAGSCELLVRELAPGRGHSELILGLTQEVLAEASVPLQALDAIAFGRGPGSFTGVRLAASVVQGLAFGAGLPVIPVSDLQAVAQRACAELEAPAVLVCNDARMREVYWTVCVRNADGLAAPGAPERVGLPENVALPPHVQGPVYGAGRGFAAYPQLAARLGPQLAGILPDLLPRAREVALLAQPRLAAGGALAPERALPVYLRDDVARPMRHTTDT